MSIFGIIGIALLPSALIFCIVMACLIQVDKCAKYILLNAVVAISIWIIAIFIGIGLNTSNERVYVQKYIAQKETIEQSLMVKELGGLEKVELVKQAVELNGEFAKRKAKFNLWHFVFYDNTIYDGVELIDFSIGERK